MTEGQELRTKLAEWAGFKKEDCEYYPGDKGSIETFITDPNGLGSFEDEYPDFPDSLDECFRWLVPKLGSIEITLRYSSSHDKNRRVQNCTVHLFGTYHNMTDIEATAETLTLAFCEAVEKLIDKEAQ